MIYMKILKMESLIQMTLCPMRLHVKTVKK